MKRRVALAAAVVTVGCWAAAAGAQDAPTTTTRADGVTGVVRVGEAPTTTVTTATPTTTTTQPTTTTTADNPEDLQPGQQTGIIPDRTYPSGPNVAPSHYDLGWDPGDGAIQVGIGPFKKKLGPAFSPIGLITSGVFTFGVLGLQMAFAITRLTLNFNVVDLFDGPVDVIGNALSANIVAGLRLRHLIIAWACFSVLRSMTRGDNAGAASDAVSTLALLFAAAVVTLNPGGLYHQAADVAQEFSIAVMDSVAGKDTPEGERLGDAYYGALQTTLVHQPYLRLNWGDIPTGACAAAVDKALVDGPHGDSDEPRNLMRDAGCPNMADYNANATWNRLFGAFMVNGINFFVSLGLAVFSLAVVVALISMGVLCAVGPIALTLGAAPGRMRRVAVRWGGALIGYMLKIIVFSGITGGFLAAIGAVASAAEDQVTWWGRWFIVVGIVFAFGLMMWKARKIGEFAADALGGGGRAPRSVGSQYHHAEAQYHNARSATQRMASGAATVRSQAAGTRWGTAATAARSQAATAARKAASKAWRKVLAGG